MKKLIKKIYLGAFILLFALVFKLPSINAASCRMSVQAPSNVIVGRSFKVTVNVSSNAALGSWEYTLSYDSSKARLTGGQLHVVDYGNGSKKSASYTYTFTALASGTASFKPVNASILDYVSTNECLSGTSSSTVTMKTQAEIEAGYSKNNNLASLSVEGGELSPGFNASTTEYSVTLPVDTTKAKINATVQDKTATVSGTGEVDVVDGPNRKEIVVTAQNGSKKTYVLNLIVKELDPIKTKVGNKNYTVVRKSGQVEKIPVGFTETKIKIDDQDITAYKSEVTKLTLVALKDEEGKVELFLYNASKKSFSAFNEVKGAATNLLIIEEVGKKVPAGFTKASFEYKDKKINGYKLKGDSKGNYYLVYAKNLETGSEDFYLYDKKDNTFQKYFSDLLETKEEKIKKMNYIILGETILLALILLTFIICVLKSAFTSKTKKINKCNKKINKLKGKIMGSSYDLESISNEPVITKIEDDEYILPKKSKKQSKIELEEARKRLEKTKPSFRRVTLEDDEEDDY